MAVTDTTRPKLAGQTARRSAAWRRYPFQLVPGDQQFVFPAAEGAHPRCQSDTWYIAGELTAAMTHRRFAYLTIFNRNRPGGSVVADFYTMALFDLDNRVYGTYTDYDMPPKSMRPGAVAKLAADTEHLAMTYDAAAGRATWIARHDTDGQLVPYTYDLSLVGTDQDGAAMELQLCIEPTRAPVPVGADVYSGRIPHGGQNETFSYFQTGMVMSGSLKWGGIDEEVAGTAGHIDRQWFPLPAGGGGTGGDHRASSHEWWTIHLDNGVDFVGWQQFDRRNRNALHPFSGATVTYAEVGAAPRCVEDLEVRANSYVRWPESVRQLVRAQAVGRYIPDLHTITSKCLDMELVAEPLVPVPAHALPIEYMEGPARFEGSMHGKPVRGFGIWERSLALYRDWELIDVLTCTVEHHKPAADELAPLVMTLSSLVAAGRRQEAIQYVTTVVHPANDPLPNRLAREINQILEDLEAALSAPTRDESDAAT
jgi:predicted secreted hydrolase